MNHKKSNSCTELSLLPTSCEAGSPLAVFVHGENHHQKKRQSIPPHIQVEVIFRDNKTCQYCGKTGIFVWRYEKPAVVEYIEGLAETSNYNGTDTIKFEIDHIIPTCSGGTNDIDNLILSCRKCNRSKGNSEDRYGRRKDA